MRARSRQPSRPSCPSWRPLLGLRLKAACCSYCECTAHPPQVTRRRRRFRAIEKCFNKHQPEGRPLRVETSDAGDSGDASRLPALHIFLPPDKQRSLSQAISRSDSL